MPKTLLTQFVGALSADGLHLLDRALVAALDVDVDALRDFNA